MKSTLVLSLAATALAASKTSVRIERFFESATEASVSANAIVKYSLDIAALEEGAAKAADARRFVYEFLTTEAKKNQASLSKILPPSTEIKPLWIGGALSVKGLSKAALDQLVALNFVTYVDLDAQDFSNPEVIVDTQVRAENSTTNEWGVEAVGAPQIWKYSTGKGAIVGSIDTGALHTHEAIKDNYRADYGWFDPYNKTDTPWDSSGHGSHTIGTMVGIKGIGVAPGAKWIACMGLYKGSGSSEALLECAQFMLCPTKPDGTAADCKKGPHVVNNSWGSTAGYSPWMEDAVAAWKAAGIIPVFSNGNSGTACATVGNPGGYKTVIGVGAMGGYKDEKDLLAYFSSKGPQTQNGAPYFKPDISAPGMFTRSVGIANNTAYRSIAGTSMAAPHVAGVVAIIKSVDPSLSYDKVYKYLVQTTDQKGLNTTEPDVWYIGAFQNVTRPGAPNCGGLKDNEWPNNRFGHGRVNIGTILRDGKLNDNRRPVC